MLISYENNQTKINKNNFRRVLVVLIHTCRVCLGESSQYMRVILTTYGIIVHMSTYFVHAHLCELSIPDRYCTNYKATLFSNS